MCYFLLFFRKKRTFFLKVVRVFLLVGAAFPEKRCAFKLCFQMCHARSDGAAACGHSCTHNTQIGCGIPADRRNIERERVWNGGFLKAPRTPARAEGCPAREPSFFACQLSFLSSLPRRAPHERQATFAESYALIRSANTSMIWGGGGGKQRHLTRGTMPNGVGWWTADTDAGNLRGVVSRQTEQHCQKTLSMFTGTAYFTFPLQKSLGRKHLCPLFY